MTFPTSTGVMRFETIVIAITVLAIVVTVSNVITLGQFELIGFVATCLIVAVTVAMDYLKSRKG